MNGLTESVLAVDAALEKAGLPHAFGGAIALAYCTEEPRGTRDVDVNIFVPASRADEALDAMPPGVTVTDAKRATARRDGQVRLRWGEIPIDLFFDTHEFHQATAEGILRVPFQSTTIPVLGCESLIVFKVMFNRPRDWADIEEIIKAGIAETGGALERLRLLVGEKDPGAARLAGLIASSSSSK